MNAPAAHSQLARALGRAAGLWRGRRLLEGFSLVLAGTAVVAAGAIAVMDASRFDAGAVSAARIAVYVVLLALVLVFMVLRVPLRRDHRRLARHLERRDPALDAMLITAVEVAGAPTPSGLQDRLWQRAAAACDDPHGPTRADRTGLIRAAAMAGAVLAVLALALMQASPAWRHGALLLANPWADARAGMPYGISASPGSVSLPEGSDLKVLAQGVGFVPREVVLMHRAEGEQGWNRVPMEAGEAGGFTVMLPALSAPLEYYVEGDTVRSATHRVALRWLPRLGRMEHRYHYPPYTGMAPRTVEDATDIAAVTGTRVEVRVAPAGAPAGGVLVLDDETRRTLAPEGELLVASLTVDEAQRYRVELTGSEGESVPVTPDHAVSALADGAPTVEVVRPRGDVRVTSVEEVAVEVRASDDVSLRRVELVLSVNGESEEVVTLDIPPGQPSASGVHTLYLEDRKLSPGDLVTFHARASDGVVARTAMSDIHFMEVRPFDRDFSRGRSGGSRRGGGGGQGEQDLAAQQRDLVVALFRLARDRERLGDEERAARLTTLSDAQGRIRERVEAIVRRIQGRAMVSTNPGYKVMMEELPRASTAMTRVEALLAVPDAQGGLPPAREALSHLQRADAAFREVQVSAQQQGGGGQGRADNNDLSRLFELEMDRFRNRYSQVQRSQAPAGRRQVDETLRELEELARRQREEVARARRRAAATDSPAGGAATQQALARELEELLRRLERLSRQQQEGGALEQARSALEQAARSMRQSGAGGAGARQAAREALERLDEARRSLTQDDPGQMAQALEEASRRAGSLAARQEQFRRRASSPGHGEDRSGQPRASTSGRGEQSARGSDPTSAAEAEAARAQGGSPAGDGDDARASRAGEQPGDLAQDKDSGRPGPREEAGGGQRAAAGGEVAPQVQAESVDDLDALKAVMEADARTLREQLDALAGGAGQEPSEARRQARQAAGMMREEDVEGRLRRSREELAAGVPDPDLEASLADALERVREQVARAAQTARAATGAAGGSGEQQGGGGEPTPEQVRSLMQGLANLREGLRRGARGDGWGPGGRDAPQLESLAGGLDRLRGPVASNAAPGGDLDTLIQGIRALAAGPDSTEATIGPDTQALLEALGSVEAALAGSGLAPAGVPVDADGRAPDAYRSLVHDYYRRLSQGASR